MELELGAARHSVWKPSSCTACVQGSVCVQQVTSLPVSFVFGFSWVMIAHVVLPEFVAHGAFPWSPSAVTRWFFMARELEREGGTAVCQRGATALQQCSPLISCL